MLSGAEVRVLGGGWRERGSWIKEEKLRRLQSLSDLRAWSAAQTGNHQTRGSLTGHAELRRRHLSRLRDICCATFTPARCVVHAVNKATLATSEKPKVPSRRPPDEELRLHPHHWVLKNLKTSRPLDQKCSSPLLGRAFRRVMSSGRANNRQPTCSRGSRGG